MLSDYLYSYCLPVPHLRQTLRIYLQEKIESSTDILKAIIKPLSKDDDEIVWPPRDQAFLVEMRKVIIYFLSNSELSMFCELLIEPIATRVPRKLVFVVLNVIFFSSSSLVTILLGRCRKNLSLVHVLKVMWLFIFVLTLFRV